MRANFQRLLRSARLLAPIVLLTPNACTLEATEVLVVVDTNAPVDRRLELTASVGVAGSAVQAHHTWVRGPGAPGSVQLPASFAVVPPSASQQEAGVTLGLHLHVEAGIHGEPAIDFERTARFGFVRHQTTVVRMYLPLECGAASHGCTTVAAALCTVAQRCVEQGQTCNNEADCASANLMPVSLAIDDASVALPIRPDVTRTDALVMGDGVAVDARDATTFVDARDATAAVDAFDAPPLVDSPPVPDVTTRDACSGACSPGATRSVACGNCGTQTDTCSATCAWTAGTCIGSGPCAPGATRPLVCGPCMSGTSTCSSACAWVAGTCTGTCCTPIAGCAGGNPIGGVCTGSGDDGCGGACTCNGVNGEACNTGSGVGSCCHLGGWFCAGQSECCPGLTCIGNICT